MRIGADEAGKGPVLGPMIAAAVRADPADLPDGMADSKRLTPERREERAVALRDHPAVEVGVAAIGVDRIDDPETDMNTLTVAAQAEAIAAVAEAGDEAIVDAGDVSEERFARRVREGVTDLYAGIAVEAEHGADDEYAIVGAASIVAKVERDRRVEVLAEEYAEYDGIGSGYPSDPDTRAFLTAYVDDHGELPACARASWSTCEDVLEAAEQSSLSEF